MDATALSKLRRSDIVALAKANKIKANLSTKEITRQLLDRFPNGVLPPTPKTPSTPLSAARNIVGRVKDAFKTISRGSRTASPSPVAQRPSQNTAATTRVQLDDTDYFADPQPPPPAHILPPLPVVDTGNATEKRGSPEALPEPGPSVQPPRLPEGKLSKDQTVPGVVVGPSQPPLPPLAPLPSNHTEEDETEYHNPAELAAADPEDVRLLIRDMAAISANNKIYIEKAAALREQALKLDDEAEDLRTALLREKFRRQRLEDYFKNWRAIDPEWSYPAIWGGDITFAPVLVGFENVNGSVVMDAEVSTSDDEELVSSWHRQDEAFRTRRRTSATQKAAERGVNIEMVSEDDLDTDEEAFYSSFVLYAISSPSLFQL
ncbi:hypothetical protein C8R44DRAFT_131544 [Mycena epipterygia]|nr:hypothetical protein C8R44DRAFT_131544 [Mycena epipterygia]